MASYIVKRLFFMIIVLLVVTVITFSLTHLIPSDPAAQWVGYRPTPKQLEQARIELGLDRPFYLRYLIYMRNLFKGDLGTSIRTKQPVIGELARYFPATFELVTVSLLISLVLGVPLGVLTAVHRESVIDHAGRLFSISGVSLPIFWLGMMLQLVVFSTMKGFPIQGRISSEVALANPIITTTGFYLIDTLIHGNFAAFKSALIHILLPATTQSLAALAIITRMARSSMIEVLRADYIRTSRAFGVSETIIKYKYALKNALIPTITVVGLAYGYELGGAILVESIFDWPGMGRYVWHSILYSDYPAIMGVTITFAIIYLSINLMVDLAYAFIDPRVQYIKE
jgi:peptide/nickel transport system permease protein